MSVAGCVLTFPLSECTPKTAQTDGNSPPKEGVASQTETNTPAMLTFIPLDLM